MAYQSACLFASNMQISFIVELLFEGAVVSASATAKAMHGSSGFWLIMAATNTLQVHHIGLKEYTTFTKNLW